MFNLNQAACSWQAPSLVSLVLTFAQGPSTSLQQPRLWACVLWVLCLGNSLSDPLTHWVIFSPPDPDFGAAPTVQERYEFLGADVRWKGIMTRVAEDPGVLTATGLQGLLDGLNVSKSLFSWSCTCLTLFAAEGGIQRFGVKPPNVVGFLECVLQICRAEKVKLHHPP